MSFAEFEVPIALIATRGTVSLVEFEVPTLLTHGLVGWLEFQVLTAPLPIWCAGQAIVPPQSAHKAEQQICVYNDESKTVDIWILEDAATKKYRWVGSERCDPKNTYETRWHR